MRAQSFGITADLVKDPANSDWQAGFFRTSPRKSHARHRSIGCINLASVHKSYTDCSCACTNVDVTLVRMPDIPARPSQSQGLLQERKALPSCRASGVAFLSSRNFILIRRFIGGCSYPPCGVEHPLLGVHHTTETFAGALLQRENAR